MAITFRIYVFLLRLNTQKKTFRSFHPWKNLKYTSANVSAALAAVRNWSVLDSHWSSAISVGLRGSLMTKMQQLKGQRAPAWTSIRARRCASSRTLWQIPEKRGPPRRRMDWASRTSCWGATGRWTSRSWSRTLWEWTTQRSHNCWRARCWLAWGREPPCYRLYVRVCVVCPCLVLFLTPSPRNLTSFGVTSLSPHLVTSFGILIWFAASSSSSKSMTFLTPAVGYDLVSSSIRQHRKVVKLCVAQTCLFAFLWWSFWYQLSESSSCCENSHRQA